MRGVGALASVLVALLWCAQAQAADTKIPSELRVVVFDDNF